MKKYLTSLSFLLFWMPVLLMFLFISNLAWTADNTGEILARQRKTLMPEFNNKGLKLGSPVFLRIFKETNCLEIWVKKNTEYLLYKSYKICFFSGSLGPKFKRGDNQAPEGIYRIKKSSLNAQSKFHLSMDIGYPNEYDLSQNYTGSSICIHGRCASIGCFAMTDPVIEEIYTICSESLNAGQVSIPVHIFPFIMTTANLEKYKKHKFYDFWNMLQPAYELFELHKRPPQVRINTGKYIISENQ